MAVPAALAATPARTALIERKLELARAREALKAEFVARPAAASLLRRLGALVDRHLREVWRDYGMPSNATLVAVGGYGRGELFPYSDVDLLILLPAPPGEALEHRLEQLIGTLWDIGLEVG